MDREPGLNVVHADHVARIAERVRLSPGSGTYFCSCASTELRARIERAFADALGGPEKVIRVDVVDNDPWNTVRRRQADESRPVRGTLYTLWGLTHVGNEDAPPGRHPYQRLNFARDAMASTGTHLLVWLDNVGELTRFAGMAPDLWTYRSEVVPFLSAEEFRLDVPAPRQTQLATRLERVERELQGAEGLHRAQLLDELATLLNEEGRFLEALAAAEEGLRLARAARLDRIRSEYVRLHLCIRQVTALDGSGRAPEARVLTLRYRAEAEAGGWVQAADFDELLARVDVPLGHGRLARLRREALLVRPEVGPYTFDVNVSNLHWLLCVTGRIRAAEQMRPAYPLRSGDARLAATRCGFFALELVARADAIRALAEFGRGVEQYRPLGGARAMDAALWDAASLFHTLGLLEARDAVQTAVLARDPGSHAFPRLLAKRASHLSADASAATGMAERALAAVRAQRESAIRLEQVQDILDAGLEASGPARDILLRGVLVGLDELPNETSAVALLRAQALHGLGRHAQAAKLGTEIANWSRDHRGPGIQSDVRVLLSDIQRELGQLRRALGFADAALACAREDEDNHRIVKAHEARARALVALKRVPEARAALEDALAVVRPEGLRPVELRLLHEIAELPEGADRAVVADEALLLSKELMFPREEARALVNLARLGLDAGEPAAPIRKWLDRAAMWTEALGPTDRLDTIRDLRARLG